jgi:hypothetical protein
MATRSKSRPRTRWQNRPARTTTLKSLYRRRLRLEPLEDRRLLALVTVDTLADTVDLGDGRTSLREAIFATNLVGGPDTIEFDPALTAAGPATILLTQGQLAITDDLMITGPGANLLSIDASGNDPTPDMNNGDGSRVFNIISGGSSAVTDATISGLQLTGGDIPQGGAILFQGSSAAALANLTLTGCTISGNSSIAGSLNVAGQYGGGIYAKYANVVMNACTVSGNVADRGGGIFSSSGTLSVADSTISSNSATRRTGGGIHALNASFAIVDSIIQGNSARDGGGGISSASSRGMAIADSIISNCIIGGNSVSGGGTGGGGASFGGTGNWTITKSAISENSSGHGGGLSLNGTQAKLTVSDCTISGNTSRGEGAGIWNIFGLLLVVDSTLSGNSAGSFGGAIWSHSDADLTVRGSTLSGNSARHGGGIDVRNATVINSTISGNSAVRGGGIYSYHGTLTVTGSAISNNSATYTAGGISIGPGPGPGNHTITDSVVHDNSSELDSGGIATTRPLTILRSTISGNSTGRRGGGITTTAQLTVAGSSIRDNFAGGSSGGIGGGSITITGSTISGNMANGSGGGISGNILVVTDSTISGNTSGSAGGGISSQAITLTNSTISGNTARTGGGMYLFSTAATAFKIRYSTIAFNRTHGVGGGIQAVGGNMELDHTILARNTAALGADLVRLFGSVDARFSLIGDNSGSGLTEAPLGSPDANGNLIGGTIHGVIDPKLAPLANNGGPILPDGSRIQSHALLHGSPAIDAGDPAAMAAVGGVPEFDQRGAPFARVFAGHIDIGAFERQPIPPAVFGDYDHNGEVDTADYVVWRKALGQSVTPFSSADGSGNGIVDQDDWRVWRPHFGMVLPAASTDSAAIVSTFSAAMIQDREPLVAFLTETNSASAGANAANEMGVRFAALETLASSHDRSPRPHGQIHRFRVADSGGDELLLLAMDRAERAARQEIAAIECRRRDHNLPTIWIDKSLTLALTEWR